MAAPGERSSLTIIVGVSGGVAAYKAVALVRLLVLGGHRVHVVPTRTALTFVGKPTWEAISRNPVVSDLFAAAASVPHIRLAQEADLVIVAPATANTMATMAAGLADDVLGNVLLATRAPVVIAPAMHSEMWEHAATQANVETLRSRGVTIVEPTYGQLTGDDVGLGRLQEPEAIAEQALAVVTRGGEHDDVPSARDLVGTAIVVSAGGTREAIDPVRFVGNRSSGRQGVALAVAAASRGARVTLVAANVDAEVLDTPLSGEVATSVASATRHNITVVSVTTADELAHEVESRAKDADVVIMTAAVADYRPASVSNVKLKKDHHGDEMTISLERTPDVLASLVAHKTPGQVIVGFAAETETDRAALRELGKKKVSDKGVDFLVANTVGWNEGFSTDNNDVIMLDARGAIVMEVAGSKRHVADRVLDVLAQSRADSNAEGLSTNDVN